MVPAPAPGVMSQASRLKNHGHVQLLIKRANAWIVENVGIKKFKLLYMANIKMHEFKHPNYYKNLRKLARLRNSDQAISLRAHDGEPERAPGSGLKPQAPSDKHQALKLSNQPQASSAKRQASQPE